MAALSTDLSSPEAVPYFLWDDPLTVAELREKLVSAPEPERMMLVGKILREARDRDVWRFMTPRFVRDNWPKLVKHLGRRRAFWIFMLDAWERQGLIG